MIIEHSSTFHMTFVQIAEFDWLSGRHKGFVFLKIFKNLLLGNYKGDEVAYFVYMLMTFKPLRELCFVTI